MAALFDLLLIAIVAPLAVALAIGCGLPKRWSVRLAYAGFGIPLLMALHVWWHYSAQTPVSGYAFLRQYSTGLDELGVSLKLGLNGVALPLFVMAGIVGFAAGLYAIQSQAERLKIYLMLLLVMQGGLMGVFASVDILFLYFFHELALIPTFIMVGVWGGRDRGYAAMKMTIYLTLGAMISLLGLIALYARNGANTFDLIALREHLARFPLAETVQRDLFGLLALGLGILVSLWPLHTWAPLGYGAAPSSNAMLHAGVLKKFGLYGLIRICAPVFPESIQALLPLLLVLIVGNILYVGYVTIAQRKLDTMLGYSSVMHMGYIFLGFAALNVVSLTGASLMLLSHGLTVALLFALCGEIRERTGTLEFSELGGIARATPKLGLAFGFAAMASVGLPGFIGFASELMVFFGAFVGQPTEMRGQTAAAAEVFRFNSIQIVTVCAVWGIVISAIYMLRAYRRVFHGPSVKATESAADLTIADRIPALLLILSLLAVGLYPNLLLNLLK